MVSLSNHNPRRVHPKKDTVTDCPGRTASFETLTNTTLYCIFGPGTSANGHNFFIFD